MLTASLSAISRARVLQGAAAAVGLPLVGCEVYSRFPPRWSQASLPPLVSIGSGAEEYVVIFPGAGGPDANTQRIVDAMRAPGIIVCEYDWSAYCGDTLRAPYNAQRVGSHIGRELSKLPGLKRIHLIGVSVGAFAADSAVATFRAAASNMAPKLSIKTTFLDPFTARGIAGLVHPASAYGVNRFGSEADEAVAVINTDDPVPSTSLPCRSCRNYDVTGAAAREQFTLLPGDSLHSWPCGWFGLRKGVLPSSPIARGAVLSVH